MCKVDYLYRGIEMSKDLSVSILIDFYGQLLTEKQAEALDLYYNDDLSLSEIADVMEISRQGVRDFIKRGEKQLAEYEAKLGLAGRFTQIKAKLEDINKLVKTLRASMGDKEELNKIESLVKTISDKV